MATIDQQFVEYIVKTLVNNPDKVEVERKIDEKGVLLSLTVDPEDVGRVIGKRGVTAQAIRVLLRALGTKQDARYNLKIVNNDEMDSSSHGNHSSATSAEDEETVANESDVEGTPESDATDDSATEDESIEDEEDEEEDEEKEKEDDKTSELAEKTRAELADLDDLDI